ncbi:alpha-1-acid glycoprotein 2 isoform X2 [Tupaia chinensis]|uniref:Alpha-1-acid glycoprotein n=1 Tax=Tupaia chinensis TaxID=246437 RepID=L9L6U7_TUPCH|nr:alpha-1-acid glycoprotein 2 isoform X2 [Tupaia chinensis]ELW70613.1 Alpha-1-acid glycoprotein 2 [Tupaia chinensis]
MALPWALTVLSLLPLLDAQNPACANLTVAPMTNATLERISGKWFYIASANRNPEYNQSSQTIQAAFFYLTPNHTEDQILLREYTTMGDKCIYNSSDLRVQRENRTISKYEWGREHFAHLLFFKDPRTFFLAAYLDDEKNRGLSFYTDKPVATQEQLEEFHEALACLDMHKSEAVYTDWRKDRCEPQDSQDEKGKKTENEES